MSTQCRVFKKLAEVEKVELATQKVELGLVDKLESRYKSLGKADVGIYLSSIQKLVTNLKSAISKTGDLQDDVKSAVSGYNGMGDADNAKIAQRLLSSIKNDFDELVFIYDKLRSI